MTRNMLITRCPDCQTSFRVTVELLLKADGMVRCGRCGSAFSAFNSLADTRNGIKAIAGETITLEAEAPPSNRAAPVAEAAPEPDVVDADPISEVEVDEVLASENAPEPMPPWTERRASRASNRGVWLTCVVAAMIVLLAQLTHHFRAELVTAPTLGPALVTVYERLGVPSQVNADPDDYEIVNWIATAEATAEMRETLRISAGIHNRSVSTRPLPLLFLKLTDRFDNPVGTRYFEPDEYLSSDSQSKELQPGTIADARLELVDPGPEAFGFEVDICVRIDARALRCKGDIAFE